MDRMPPIDGERIDFGACRLKHQLQLRPECVRFEEKINWQMSISIRFEQDLNLINSHSSPVQSKRATLQCRLLSNTT